MSAFGVKPTVARDDHMLAVGRVEHYLFCVNEADRRRGRSPALWKILEQALRDVN
jgi:hypothetical protein